MAYSKKEFEQALADSNNYVGDNSNKKTNNGSYSIEEFNKALASVPKTYESTAKKSTAQQTVSPPAVVSYNKNINSSTN